MKLDISIGIIKQHLGSVTNNTMRQNHMTKPNTNVTITNSKWLQKQNKIGVVIKRKRRKEQKYVDFISLNIQATSKIYVSLTAKTYSRMCIM